MEQKKFKLSSRFVKNLSVLIAVIFASIISGCLLYYKGNYMTASTTAIIFLISFSIIYMFLMLIVFRINKREVYEEKQELNHQRELTCLSDKEFI